MPEPQPPLWLLDIDGVVNALSRVPLPDVWPLDSWRRCVIRAVMPGNGYMVLPILAAQPVLDFVTELHESARCEVQWHSTWRSAAITELAPALDLPGSIPISVAPEWTEQPPGWWKLPAARRAVASGRRLVWTDDDIAAYADQVGDLGGDTLVLAPDPITGLSPADLAAIAAFVDR